ncbi:MAG: hypothetical protein HY714_04300 [Candidatus Omnitrophica bacterium]|nr:hypothetical protein [Candidatus Omnitrophota bacterium]
MRRTQALFLLEDILETKFGSDKERNRKLAARILQGNGSRPPITAVSSFTLGKSLLIVKNGRPRRLNRLYLLDSTAQSLIKIPLKLPLHRSDTL